MMCNDQVQGECKVAEPNLIRNALTNVLANAWKYTRLRGSVLVEFGNENLNGEKGYFVRDNGIGCDVRKPEGCSVLSSAFPMRQNTTAAASA
jgi:hypothetical protein